MNFEMNTKKISPDSAFDWQRKMFSSRFKLKWFLLILLVQNSISMSPHNALYNEVFTYNNETEYKAYFAQKVVEKIQTAFRQWFFTIIFCEFTYFENRIVKYTETYNDGYPVFILSSCPDPHRVRIKPRIDKHGETTYIVSSDELSVDVNEYVLAALIRTGVWNPRSSVIFVINVPVEIDSYFYHTMKNHFKLLRSNRISNSVLFVWCDRLKVYIFNPFLDEVKDVSEEKDLTKLTQEQYHNLHGKEIRLSVFRKVFLSDDTGPVNCDSRLTKTVMTSLNATCKPIPPRDGKTVGGILENGTATGVTADLLEGYTELELNSRILQNSYYGYIDTTYPLDQDELCFLVKKSSRQSSFTTTIKLMKENILTMFIANLVILTLIGLLAYKVEKYMLNIESNSTTGTTLMDLVKCYIRQTVDIKFMGPVYRGVVLMIMTYSLIIDCAVDGIIISAITYPRYRPDIDTLAELAESNLTLAIHSRHIDMFQASLSPNYEDLLLSPVEIVGDRKIKKIIEEREFQYAVLMRKTDSQFLSRKQANMKDGRPLYHTVLECPLPCFIVYGLEYGSPYLTRVNKIIHYLYQGGILTHWIKTEESLLYQKQSKIFYTGDTQEKKPLNMSNLKEVFYVWLIGLGVSVIGFAFEIGYSTVEKALTV